MNAKEACQELQRIDTSPPARQEPQDLLALAVQKGADVATLERLMVVRTQLKAERSREAYFDSLAAFQSECPVILRSQAGHENRYRYAPLERIVKEVAPLLHKHGFAHQEDGVVTDGWVEAVVTVTHREGHSEVKRFKVPAESKAGMSPQQKYGAAMTYATRYAFCAAFGIRTGEKDTDCPPTGEGPEVIVGLKSMLWTLLKKHEKVPAGGTWKHGYQWFIDERLLADTETLEELDSSGWRKLLAAASKKLEGK